eukprot:6713458-Prymnesium_polylepis.1
MAGTQLLAENPRLVSAPRPAGSFVRVLADATADSAAPPEGCADATSNCLSSKRCCAEGLHCFRQFGWGGMGFAQCRAGCNSAKGVTKGWSCEQLDAVAPGIFHDDA